MASPRELCDPTGPSSIANLTGRVTERLLIITEIREILDHSLGKSGNELADSIEKYLRDLLRR